MEDIIELIHEVSATEISSDITRETRLAEDLAFFSFEVFSVVSELEDKYDISFSEKKVRKAVTVGDLADLLQELIG